MPTVYPIRMYGDPILRRKAREISDLEAPQQVAGFAPVTLRQLAEDMFETMFEAGGVGLAAPQVGLPIRMFVAADYNDDVPEGHDRSLKARLRQQYVVINPTLEVLDPRLEARYDDGCLSLPGIYEPGVQRERAVRLRYTDLEGQQRITEADDYLARVFQHEFEHLEGRLYLDRLPPEVTERHRARLAEFQREARAYLKRLEQQDQRQKRRR
nr:peptide deformylase [Deinobacterium chartae]